MTTLKLGNITRQDRIAAFDLDWTLIHSSRGVFPKDANDWQLLPLRKERLLSLEKTGYSIVIVTNQRSKGARRTMLTERLINIYNHLKTFLTNVVILASFEDDEYRKPKIGLWTFESCPKSFYCGDADGSSIAFGNTDIKFAENIGVQFLSVHHPKMFPSYFLERKFQFQPVQTLVILVGAPHTGKKRLCRFHFKEWGIIHVPLFKSQLDTSLLKGKGVVALGTNGTKSERAPLIRAGADHGCRVIILVLCRDGHNACQGKIKDVVYHSWFKQYEEPTEDEGEIINIW